MIGTSDTRAYDRGMAASSSRVRVLVADDHPLFREAVVRAVKERPELELVAEAADGTQALEAIRDVKPDVAVLDVKMPGLDGIKVANAVARDRLPTRGTGCRRGSCCCRPSSTGRWPSTPSPPAPPPTCPRTPTGAASSTRSPR